MSFNELLEYLQSFEYAGYSSLLLTNSDSKRVQILSGVPFLIPAHVKNNQFL